MRLLENLLRNAVEHGGNTVSITWSGSGFEVADNGRELPDSVRASLEKGTPSMSDQAGLGLLIVAEIAEMHDCTVAAPSEGEDTVIRIDDVTSR